MVLDRVLVAVLARRDQARVAFGPIGVDQVDLGRLVVVRLDGDELARTGSGRRRRRSPCPSPRRPARPTWPACPRGGGRRTAGAGWHRGARRTASGCRAPQTMALRVSGMASRRSLPVARSRMRDREELGALLVDGIGEIAVVGAVRGGTRAASSCLPSASLLPSSRISSRAAAARPPAQARILAAGDVADEVLVRRRREPAPSCRPP